MLLVVARHLAETNISPSLSDIREELNVGKNTNLSTYIRPLVAKGYLRTGPRYARRSFELTVQAIPMLAALLHARDDAMPEVEALIHDRL